MNIISTSVVGNLNVGQEAQALNINTSEAGFAYADFAIQSDALLVTLIATSVSSSLDVSVVAIDQESGLESEEIIAFPLITGPAGNLLVRRSGTAPATLRLKAVVGSGGAQFRIKVRAVNAGTSDTKILGADSVAATQATAGTSPTILIAASLLDRAGLVIKNWSITQTVYIGETAIKADPAIGYPLAPRDALAMDVSAGVSIWIISDAPGADIRILQAGA